MELRPGTKVIITIEATVMQAFDGTPMHLVYGDEHALVIRPDEPGVTVKPA